MSAETYLGEFPVDICDSPFKGFKSKDWALQYIFQYGQIDGDHHKAWVLDQVARILCGATVEVVVAKWSDHPNEYRFRVLDDSSEYDEWVEEYEERDEDGEPQYEYDVGIAP